MYNLKNKIILYAIGGLLFGGLMDFVVLIAMGPHDNYLYHSFAEKITNLSTLPLHKFLTINCPKPMVLTVLFCYFFFWGGMGVVFISLLNDFFRKRGTPRISLAIIAGITAGMLAPPLLMISALNPSHGDDKQNLLYAIETHDHATVEYMLKNGANTNFNFKGDTPLIKAIRENDVGITELLLKYNANPNMQGMSGHTPLLFAAGTNFEILKTLIQHHADINAINSYGHNALSFCLAAEHLDEKTKIEMIRYLGKQGINPNLGNPEMKGLTVLDYATGYLGVNAAPCIVSALREIGAKTSVELRMEMPVEQIDRTSVFVARIEYVKPATIVLPNGLLVPAWQMHGVIIKNIKPAMAFKPGNKIIIPVPDHVQRNVLGSFPPEKIKDRICWIALQNKYGSHYLGDIDIYPLTQKK